VWVQYVGVDADGNDTYVLTSTSEECVHLSHDQVARAVEAMGPVGTGHSGGRPGVAKLAIGRDDDTGYQWSSPTPSETTYHPEE
jgi:hypothetical protein